LVTGIERRVVGKSEGARTKGKGALKRRRLAAASSVCASVPHFMFLGDQTWYCKAKLRVRADKKTTGPKET